MYKGTVRFEAKMLGNRLQFSAVRLRPAVDNVAALELRAAEDAITASVELPSVSTPDEGVDAARVAVELALDRLAYSQQISIGPAVLIDRAFTALNPPAGTVIAASTGMLSATGHAPMAIVVVGMNETSLRSLLEPASLPGENYFGLLRSARLSVSAVEEFMHLYGIVLAIFSDDQRRVDAFIVSVDSAVPRTPSLRPNAKPGEMETVYTRLRNELAHKRSGVSIDTTKKEMAQHVVDLRSLVKVAIQQNP